MAGRTKKYGVTLRIKVKSKAEAQRLEDRIRALFHCGTLCDSLVDGLDLNFWPDLVSVRVKERPGRRVSG
jgi:hypothetical protein